MAGGLSDGADDGGRVHTFFRQNGLGPVRGAAGAVFLWAGMKGGPNGGDLFMTASRRLGPAVFIRCGFQISRWTGVRQ